MSVLRRQLFRSLAGAALAMVVVLSGISGGFYALKRVQAASAPNIIAYQGRVLNANNVPVADTSASMIFELYDAVSAGTCRWSNSSSTCASATARTVTLTAGLFSEYLGDTAASTPYPDIPDTLFSDYGDLYLQVTINGETLSPRKRLASAPYALNSDTLDGYNATQTGGTLAAVLVLDSSGNLQLTGSPQSTSVSGGSLYINPATGVVAANEVLFGVAVNGTSRFLIDGEGDTALLGDFIVGGSTLTAPFSVDESTNTVRIGDGVNDALDPSVTFFASDAADSGIFSYADDDRFTFNGGNILFNGLGTLPTTASGVAADLTALSTFSGTSGGSLNIIEMYSGRTTTTYSAVEGSSTDHVAAAEEHLITITGASATLTNGFATRSFLQNDSTNASLVQGTGYLSSIEGEFMHNATATSLATAYGVHGLVYSKAGTIAAASGVVGEVSSNTGTVTTAYGGQFLAKAAGATRYGVYAEASGGATANYAGYFAGSLVQIDDDGTPNAAGLSAGAGDLYVLNELEVDGSASFGDTTGTDLFDFTSAATTQDVVEMTFNSLTGGTGLALSRAAGGADYDGKLLMVSQLNSSATTDANAFLLTNNGGGNSVGMYIVQNTLSAHVANSTGNNALVIDVNEASGNENMVLFRSDADGSPDTEFRVESDGDLYADGAAYNAGADYAEFFYTTDASLSDYEVVCQDDATAEAVKTCEAGNTQVMGVISTNPAFVGNNFVGASGDLSSDPRYRKVGMVGQIDTLVNAGEGAIAIGDPLTTSAVRDGYGAKAHGPVRIIGFALEPLASGTGTIRVLVQPQWYGGDMLAYDGEAMTIGDDAMLTPLGTATASASFASADLALRGSGWNGSAAVSKDMALRTRVESGSDNYRLSVVNDDGSEVAYIGEAGDMAISGRLYPSDRGTLQTSKYIYYDGSSGSGGDFMRTNASGWGSGSYDFAEMFPSAEALAAGEVVIFADAKETVRRSAGTPYDDKIAGVVSSRPGFLAGDNIAGHVPVALAGRVPTYVSAENGAIAIGDPLTTSSKPGYAMKATEAGPIVGYAMETFSGNTGVVSAFIRPSYYDGGAGDDSPGTNNAVSQIAEVTTLDINGLNLNGGSIISVASLSGISGMWRIEEDGDLVTRGRVMSLIRSYANEDVEATAVLSRQTTIQLTGTSTLQNGGAHVEFDDVDPAFNDIITKDVPYRVFVTPAGATGMLYVTERTHQGFVIRGGGTSADGTQVDWLVVAYHKDFAPEELPVVEDDVTEVPVEEQTEALVEKIIEETPADEAVEEPTETTNADAEDANDEEETATPVDEEAEDPAVVEASESQEAEPATEPVENDVTLVAPVADDAAPDADPAPAR